MDKKINKLALEIQELIEDLGWEYDRMTSSGKESYDKLASIVGL